MNNFIKFLVFVMVFTMSLGVMAPAYAADLAVNLGVGSKATTIDTTFPVEDQSEAEQAAAGATDIYITYQATAEFVSGDTVNIVASSGLTLAQCGAGSTTDADQDTAADGTSAVSGSTYTYTFNAGTTAATTSVTFCLNVDTTAGGAGNYSFIVGDSNGDSGSAMLYTADANDVTVTASVEGEELEFRIRDYADSADANSCGLGTLTTTSVSTCNYRLKVRTTATEGYSISWTSDGGLASGGTATIDAVAVDTAVTAGNEQYGVQFYAGSNTDGGACNYSNIWDATPDDPVSTTAQTLVNCTKANFPSASSDTTYTHTMDHKAAINAGTPAGSYQQIVTYYVTANF